MSLVKEDKFREEISAILKLSSLRKEEKIRLSRKIDIVIKWMEEQPPSTLECLDSRNFSRVLIQFLKTYGVTKESQSNNMWKEWKYAIKAVDPNRATDRSSLGSNQHEDQSVASSITFADDWSINGPVAPESPSGTQDLNRIQSASAVTELVTSNVLENNIGSSDLMIESTAKELLHPIGTTENEISVEVSGSTMTVDSQQTEVMIPNNTENTEKPAINEPVYNNTLKIRKFRSKEVVEAKSVFVSIEKKKTVDVWCQTDDINDINTPSAEFPSCTQPLHKSLDPQCETDGEEEDRVSRDPLVQVLTRRVNGLLLLTVSLVLYIVVTRKVKH